MSKSARSLVTLLAAIAAVVGLILFGMWQGCDGGFFEEECKADKAPLAFIGGVLFVAGVLVVVWALLEDRKERRDAA